ncbi:MAG TPA: hypothetical protein VFS54_02710 [Solirubrobacterales bacterium]|nr:hypothetical protein [Solirubrobacterales bacterium]
MTEPSVKSKLAQFSDPMGREPAMCSWIGGIRTTFALGLLLAAAVAVPASAAELPPYNFDPALSLVGKCGVSALDPVEDPGCPGGTHPPSGRFDEPRAIAIDQYGYEYVASYANGEADGRIDVFDDEGVFVTEFVALDAVSIAVDGEGVVYVFEDSGKVVRYEPAVYKPETGEIEYEDPPSTVAAATKITGGLAVDAANDHLLVVRGGGTITEYKSAKDNNEVASTFAPAKLASSSWVNTIAVDAQNRRIYVSYCKGAFQECGFLVYEADAPHGFLAEIDGSTTPAEEFSAFYAWLSIAIDEESGSFFIGDILQTKDVYEFDENYNYVSKLTFPAFEATTSTQIAVSNGESPAGDALNRHYLFVPLLASAGRAFAFKPRGVEPPTIDSLSVGSIGETEAELQATVDPQGGDTTYVFEFTTQQVFEQEGFASAQIVGGGTVPAANIATRVVAPLSGLLPETQYRFRIHAENEAGEDEDEAGFATYSDAASAGACSNQSLRVGPSAHLPDCRAYELVTPADTNGRPIKGAVFLAGHATPMASPAGNAVTFRIEGGALPGLGGVASFFGDRYWAKRGPSGWTSALGGPTGEEATVVDSGSHSPDQGYSFWTARVEGPAVIEGGETRYLNYPDGHSELIGRGSLGATPRASGLFLAENASHVIFQAVVQLEPSAPVNGGAIYDRTVDPDTGVEETHVVSVLPGEVPLEEGKGAAYLGASKDGEGVAFRVDQTMYLRVANAVTYEIGENVTLAGISEGGTRIFYVEGGNLEAFDIASEEVLEFSDTGDVTPVNVAPEGTRAYFVSPSVLGGPNPLGAVAQAGEQNLYLSEEGSISFVATVTDRDVQGEVVEGIEVDGLGLWTEALDDNQPVRDPSRVNPDGSVLLFQSRADLEGFDSGDSPQIYRFDSAAGRLHCISCNPARIPATAGSGLASYAFKSDSPEPSSLYGVVANITPDGNRAFFESDESLVSTDANGVKDVYEWEEQGTGSCKRAGGCVYLLSSGHSERDNFLYGHSSSGSDVFIATADLLTGADGDEALSVYDARVLGGFPEEPKKECEGEGCRPALTAPPTLWPANQDQTGGQAEPKPRTCPKGKRKAVRNGKTVCVKKRSKRAHRSRGQRGGDANRNGAAR